jgi:hypothetical protein
MITIIQFAVALVCVIVFFFIVLFVGFCMGRQTVDKPVKILPISKVGGQPLFEEDKYADAMRREKSEGSL